MRTDQRTVGSEEEKHFIQLSWHICYGDESVSVQPIMVSRTEADSSHTLGHPGLMGEREGNQENKQIGGCRRVEGAHPGMRVQGIRDSPQRSGGVSSTSELASYMVLVSAGNGGSRGRARAGALPLPVVRLGHALPPSHATTSTHACPPRRPGPEATAAATEWPSS